MMLLLIGFGGRLLPTWMMLNTLQLMVHLPLLPVYLPSNMSFLLSEYLRTMQIRSNELEQYLIGADFLGEQDTSSTDSDEYLSSLSLLKMYGYAHSISLNLALVMLAGLGMIVATMFAKCLDCSHKRKGGRGKLKMGKQRRQCTACLCNFNMRIVYELFLELSLCVGI